MSNDRPVLGFLGCPALPSYVSALLNESAISSDSEDDPLRASPSPSCRAATSESSLLLLDEGPAQNYSTIGPQAISCSPIGSILVAAKGRGSFEAALPLDEGVLLRPFEPSQCLLVPVSASKNINAHTAVFTESRAHSSDCITAVLQVLASSAPSVQLDSQCKYAIIARGQADGYLRLTPRYFEKIWDHAAGVIMGREAGGIVTDGDGKQLAWSRGG
ncbi:MAG: inositol monophosphatase family protein, partial [archaeon]|nr:inositol monophosphatase family protein [archaeon]